MKNNFYNFKRVTFAYLTLFILMTVLFSSCENNIKADFDTVKAKNIILINGDGKEYKLKIIRDPAGIDRLEIEPLE